MYNNIRASRDLQAAGLATAMADAIATVVGDSMTSSREQHVTKDFLRAELAAVRTETATARTEVATAKNDMIRWLIGSQFIFFVALVALMSFMNAMR